MTRRDRWKQRPCVTRYHAFKDLVRIHRVRLPEQGAHVIFVLPMPPSWSERKKDNMIGRPHQQKPDKDNLEKALLDALFNNDAHIWDSRVTKIWGYEGKIIIRDIVPDRQFLQIFKEPIN